MSQTQFYLIIYLVLVIVAGAGEYLHLLPMGTFSNVLLAVFGHAAGVFSPAPAPLGGGAGAGEGKNN